MSFAETQATACDYLVASVIATEVPPRAIHSRKASGPFTVEMIPYAIRAVCDTIRNRVASPDFPDEAAEVVLQIKQFSGVLRGLRISDVGHRDIWPEAVSGKWFPQHVALCLSTWREGRRLVPGDVLYYYSPVSMIPSGRVPSWARRMREHLVSEIHKDYFRFYAP